MAAFLTWLGRVPERMMHPFRRRRVLGAVARRAPPGRVLIVCHGNICRSPFAAALLARELAGVGARVESAGLVGADRPPPPRAVVAASRRGVDLSPHRSRLLIPELARWADLIVVMDAEQGWEVCARFGRWRHDVILLGDVDPAPIETRTIRDPVGQGPEVFEESYARIERCVAALARALVGDNHGPPA